ncbi:MAG: 23S rRNA (adenine(2503)-C(2))-methyltransferase RlmN [Pseudomonadota bacterium]|nr:23S rRNA (adenine(2503)-C(2))-methyltransferase RlmN [Pseudomonadota bacterium]
MSDVDLIGLTRDELEAELGRLGLPPFRMRQVWHWMYYRGARSFADMTTIAKPVRAQLAESYRIGRLGIVRDLTSVDGTRKWLLSTEDGNEIESVFIPEEDRGALCVSSQIGCSLNCSFCHTGTQMFVRNLTAGEIVGQVMILRDALGEWCGPMVRRFTNIVVMGMGEPLFNYDNIAAALKIIMDGDGLAISKRRITLSTSGVVPMIERVGRDLGVNLAVSLHATNDELRTRIMPINRKYPLAKLMEACRNYPTASNARRITFEYLMLKGVNDSDADAHAFVKLIKGVHAKINLIPFNPWPGCDFESSDPDRIEAFAQILLRGGYACPIRQPRGQDIMAACGQLRSESQRSCA